jgi:hypothetical protein
MLPTFFLPGDSDIQLIQIVHPERGNQIEVIKKYFDLIIDPHLLG